MHITDRRQAPRISLDLFAELHVEGVAYPAVIHKLSRFGAFVRCNSQQFAGAHAELAITLEGDARIGTTGTIVYRVRAADAAKLGTVAGIGMRFWNPFSAEAERFAAAVEQLRSGNPVVAKPTRRMRDAVLSSLLDGDTPSKADRLVFTGSLAGLGVPTLLSLLEGTRKTGRLLLERGRVSAKLELSVGQIVGVWSSVPDHTPDKILMNITGWNEGTFELASMAPPPCPVGGTPALSIKRLLLAHALHQDEVARRRAMAAGAESRSATPAWSAAPAPPSSTL